MKTITSPIKTNTVTVIVYTADSKVHVTCYNIVAPLSCAVCTLPKKCTRVKEPIQKKK